MTFSAVHTNVNRVLRVFKYEHEYKNEKKKETARVRKLHMNIICVNRLGPIGSYVFSKRSVCVYCRKAADTDAVVTMPIYFTNPVID